MDDQATSPPPASTHASQKTNIEVPEAPEMGLSGWTSLLMLAGLFLLVLRGLFTAILVTSDDPSEGMTDTSVWFGWMGLTALSLALIGAGFRAKSAGLGSRVALILVGAYFLQNGSSGVAEIFANLFGAF